MQIPFTRALVPAALIALAAFGWSRSQSPTPAPTAEQKRFEPLVGEWEVEMTMHSPMGDIPGQGVETNRMIGGRWLESEFEGSVMGQPFEGRGLFGWDAVKEQYVGVWVDSMGSQMAMMTGEWSEEDGAIEWTWETTEEMSGQHGTARNIDAFGGGTRAGKFFFKPDGGEETQTLELAYRRKGEGKPAEASKKK